VESDELRQRLRDVGVEKFIQATLIEGGYSAQKLCSAFRVHVPGFTGEDEALYHLLGFALHRELSHRKRLAQYSTIDDAAQLLNEAKNIIVITGAGVCNMSSSIISHLIVLQISTSLGIPDFRSKDTGFYSKLREKGFPDPESLFTLEEFDHDPSGFYSLAGDLLPVQGRWSPTHQFLRVLQDRNKLLRNYTQNIDNVESYAGIAPEKIIHCHGSWKFASCRKCKTKIPGEQIFDNLRRKEVATCKLCEQRLALGSTMKRKRSFQGSSKPRKKGDLDDDDSEDDDIPQAGVMKPDITFFGESLPDLFYDTLNNVDRDAVDLIIVIGTSMKVAPVSEIPQHVKNNIPQILISRDPIKHIEFDINLLGNCDTVVQELCRRADWSFSHEMIKKDEKIAVSSHPEIPYAYTVTTAEVPHHMSVSSMAIPLTAVSNNNALDPLAGVRPSQSTDSVT
jgi:NAD-dependent histone deacetylase SIR2